jgi:hypothetical protein
MQIFILKSPGIEVIPYPTHFEGIKEGKYLFSGYSIQIGFGLNPAFLLDIELRYSYIQANQKRILFLCHHAARFLWKGHLRWLYCSLNRPAMTKKAGSPLGDPRM